MATAAEHVLEVLMAHEVKRGVRDMQTHCKCDWISTAIADGRYQHMQHQAAEIVKAQRKTARKTKKVAS